MSLALIVDPAAVPDYPALGVALGVQVQTFNGPATPYGHNIPAAGYFVMRKCNGDPPTFFDGPLTAQQAAAIPACATDVNEATIRQRAQAGISRRNTFIALANPTNAQLAAEIKAQAKDLNGLARLFLGQLDTAGDA